MLIIRQQSQDKNDVDSREQELDEIQFAAFLFRAQISCFAIGLIILNDAIQCLHGGSRVETISHRIYCIVKQLTDGCGCHVHPGI